ncbi:hypothetical protein CLPUN_38800 [Clostridium puniceum]|uniref:N-acetyltransferase domain-containing protein n=1 Tax=Clostridium puniceum TaxID=29367 RepID=A0A1S8TA29_9CLOT|nr:GNAT family N-acetyltransferase [Clostridium puniceum]OOM74532.1 hypothetical protein CLPUN_38800 [Clostridium puniceum]
MNIGVQIERFKLISNYMKNDKYRKSFNELAIKTFNIDFDKWFKEGLLNENYINYSFLCEDKVVANVSVNKFFIIYNGQIHKSIQIGTVMTKEEYRNKGLIRKLMDKILKEYEEYDLIYLFANKSVLDFYPKFGFKRVIEGKYEMNTNQIEHIQLNNNNIMKLNLEKNEHKRIIKKIAQKRIAISQKLCAIKDMWPLYVYCNYEFRDELYYLKQEEIIVILKRENDVVELYDILSENDFDLDRVICQIIKKEDKRLKFKFVPDSTKSKYIFDFELIDKTEDYLFILEGKETLSDGILFPITSHT